MSKGSVRKKGNKWYYRFYVEDESGRRVQKEFAGTENRRETEELLHKAMDAYESTRFIPRPDSCTVGELLNLWMEEDVKPGQRSNGTIMTYQGTINRIRQHPLGSRKVKTVTPEHLQDYVDFLCFGNSKERPLATGTIRVYMAVLKGAFQFAVFPKRLIAFNPMQYVIRREVLQETELFGEGASETDPVITHQQFLQLCEALKGHPALLPVQISYYSGLRIGEVCALTWNDIDLIEQRLVVRRSMRYNNITHRVEVGPPKRKKFRTVDFCDTLTEILTEARERKTKEFSSPAPSHQYNYYKMAIDRGRKHYDLYTFPCRMLMEEEFRKLEFVCVKPNGTYCRPDYIRQRCRVVSKRIAGMENFHFHMLRHTYTSNLLRQGANPKVVQELLGHSNMGTTINVYAHSVAQERRASAKLLDAIASEA